ncbi:MAG: hypothetical protein PHG05_00145 [Candidatus Nanoarchaeia archaeon]|nr:hypothetical protein [Candidatus Nanoarchaeia archaeon]
MRRIILRVKKNKIKILVVILLVGLILLSIPNLLWKKPIPDKVPAGMNVWIEELSKTKDQEECLYKAYDLVTTKWTGGKYKTYSRFNWLFVSNLDKIWHQKSKYMYCMTFNYILRTLLVKSGCFDDKDIEQRISMVCIISPHQYLSVNLKNGGNVYIDAWARAYGVEFGDYTRGFYGCFNK